MPPVLTDDAGTFSPRARRRLWAILAVVPLFVALVFFIVYPVGILLLGSFVKGEPTRLLTAFRNLTLSNYIELYGSAALYRALGNSVAGCGGGAALALVIGLFFAWVVARTDVRAKGLIEVVAIMPLFISPVVASMAWAIPFV